MLWLDDAEQSEFAQLEEPFAVIHKCTLQGILEERKRDAAPQPGRRRSARKLLQKIEHLVLQVVTVRWLEARGTGTERAFRAKWVATGFAALRGAGDTVQLLFYMRAATRKRWQEGAPMTRIGEYAPPSVLPAETVTIFTDGGANYDPKVKAWVAAGFGLVAVEDGDGEEGGRCAFEECGPIHVGQEGGENLTNNTAEMIGFIHALRYAREPARASRPILVRFDSRYAALCGSGVWKGKRNKKLVATARAEWEATATLKKHSGVGFWLKHVKGHSGHKWNDAADGLATRGLDGERRRVYLPRVVD